MWGRKHINTELMPITVTNRMKDVYEWVCVFEREKVCVLDSGRWS